MDRFWEIAAPATWGLLTLASTLLLAGFVLLSHTLVRSKAYGDGWGGWLSRGWLEATVRVGIALLVAGSVPWAITLDAPPWVPWLLAAAAAVPSALQGVAMMRERGGGRAERE